MNRMTLLLFLASLAVMEFLVGKLRHRQDDRRKADETRGSTAGRLRQAETSTAGLLALGQALEAHGQGEAPEGEPAPQVHGPPADGV